MLLMAIFLSMDINVLVIYLLNLACEWIRNPNINQEALFFKNFFFSFLFCFLWIFLQSLSIWSARTFLHISPMRVWMEDVGDPIYYRLQRSCRLEEKTISLGSKKKSTQNPNFSSFFFCKGIYEIKIFDYIIMREKSFIPNIIIDT